MRFSMVAAAVAELFFVSSVTALNAKIELGYIPPPPPDVDGAISFGVSRRADSPVKAGTFQQLIDHKNPELGTFSQRYWWNAEHYEGPGSPIVLNAPGEFAADRYTGYTTNKTLPGVFAQTNGGATILLEHRYWGESSPYKNLTAETLQYLTLDEAIADLIYFAKNVKLEFDPEGGSRPDKAPWILSGCSYPGALAGWVQKLAPGTFWAYHCSSAVVQTVGPFWQYFAPIDAALPKNCSADFKRVTKYIDRILLNGTAERKQHLKERFGFGDLKYDDDFASALIGPLFGWQGTKFYSGTNSAFQMCDWIEGQFPNATDNKPVPGAEGVGTCKAVKNLAKFWREYYLPGDGSCGDGTLDCYGSHDSNSEVYKDTSVLNPYNRQWEWMLCNEAFEYWQAYAPGDTIGYPSTLFDTNYWRRQCGMYFPDVNGHVVGIKQGRSAETVNKRTDGWNNVDTERLMWVNGEYDPWRSATVASDFRPGGPLQYTEKVPAYLIPKAAHCNDMIIKNAEVNPGVKKVVDGEVKKMKEWVDDFYKQKKGN